MSTVVDYYLAPQSPWTYLGHARLCALLAESGAAVRVRPVDLGEVFPVSGGLPLAKRAPQRQAYRLLELQRYSSWLGLPLNPQPRFFPVSADAAARLIIAVDRLDGSAAALKIAGAIMAAVWAEERNIADPDVLAALLTEQGLASARLHEIEAQRPSYAEYTRQAIEAGVFGAPSYVVDGEIFWGQDRLDFLRRRLLGPQA